MESKTTNKKQIVDFLWDWAGSPCWAKLLVQKVVSTESSLLPGDREDVFKYFLQAIGLEKGLPSLTFTKPTYSPTSKTIELSTLSDVTGVNMLAKEQTIQFAPNLTVIYGENGTGKTGYGRILKALGFSYDQNNTILANIFGETEPQSAKIEYKANGKDNTFTWSGQNRNNDLASISVFNNNCVQISLDSSRQLIVSPIGFHLFNLVSSELGVLDKLLKEKKKEYPVEINWVENLHEETPQQQFIDTLSKNSEESKLLELSNFGEVQENELSKKEEELSNLNKSLLQNEIRSLNSQIKELSAIIESVDQTKSILNADTWKQLIEYNKSISELEQNTQKGISEIAASKGIEFYETNEFKSFLSSAEAYIKKINKPDYPQNEDVCVYCRQPLANNAKELLENYRRLLNDKSEENLTKLKESKQLLIERVGTIDTNIKLNYPSFGLDEKENPIQPNELKGYSNALGLLKKAFINDEVTEDSVFEFEYDGPRAFIKNRNDQLQSTLTTKTGLFENVETKEKEIKKNIAELKDRKYLSMKVDEIKNVISNYKTLSVLNKNSNSFSTNSISRKTSQAREELVSQDFNDAFQEELKALRKSGLPIELSFGTDRGTTKLSHRISNHQLLEILSEGEQKAIALAEFLTELQLDAIKAPVIFDDPVNSLDHKIIDAVAKRLMRLSQVRQVVIFTHSVLLFNSLLYLNSQSNFKQLKNRFYNTRNEYNETGFISDAEEEINSVKQRITNINKYIQSAKERPELEVVKDCYDELRSAIELCVEHEIFKGTVKRYQKNISLTNFLKIDSTKIGAHQEALNDIFDRCCGFIGAHSNPEYVCNSPSLTGFTADFEDFKKIRKEFV
jgi:energy-coupling factor transporter ATP-binding protein EcfA2